MKDDYLICDPRPLEAFKDMTFSGFKKTDVLSALLKSIDTGKVEDACFWTVECICSGYLLALADKLMIHASKVIHINSPNLPMFLLRRYTTLVKSLSNVPKKQKDRLIHLRNTQEVRNNLIDVVVTLTMAPKTKRYDKYPKVNLRTDFQFQTIQERMNATMQIVPSQIIKFTDPDELRIIMNEIFFNLKNTNGGYERVCYWIAWLVQWEKRNKAQSQTYEIEERPIHNVLPKYCKDMIWLVWEILFEEATLRDTHIQTPIQALFQLFRQDYTSGKRNARLPYLYQSVGLLTLPANFKIPARIRRDIFIQTQCNINIWFQSRKTHEVKNYHPPPKVPKKSSGANTEIIESRMNDLLDLDAS